MNEVKEKYELSLFLVNSRLVVDKDVSFKFVGLYCMHQISLLITEFEHLPCLVWYLQLVQCDWV